MDLMATAQLLGNVGEFVGSIAILVTLAYLAIQVRHARHETRLALSQGRMQANRELIALELDPANLEARMRANAALGFEPLPAMKVLMDTADLSLEDAYRVAMVEIAAWNYRIHVISNANELSQMERRIFDGALRNRLRNSAVSRLIAESILAGNSPEVRSYVENALAGPHE